MKSSLAQSIQSTISPQTLGLLGGLNPYLLFDAESSMIGTLENPTLDLDPSVPSSLDVITAVRAGVATYTDESGLIQEAVANTVRVDHSLGYPAMLIEPSATNLVTYSENFSSWNENDVSLTSGQASPAGDNTATKLTATGGDPWVYTIINTSAQTNTFSFYCRGEGTSIGKTARLLFWYVADATGTTESFDFTYTSEWQRVEFQTTPTGAGSLLYRIDLPADTSEVDDVAYIWGAQLEAGSVATSYIPTSGGNEAARTRAADDLAITGSAFTDFYNQSEGTVYVEFVPKLEALDATLFNFSDGSNFNRIMSLTKFYHIFVTTSGNTQVQFASGSVSLNNLNRLAASFKTNDCVLSLNGSSEVVDSSMAMPSINQINIGTRFGGTDHLQGHIRRLIYWPTSSDRL